VLTISGRGTWKLVSRYSCRNIVQLFSQLGLVNSLLFCKYVICALSRLLILGFNLLSYLLIACDSWVSYCIPWLHFLTQTFAVLMNQFGELA